MTPARCAAVFIALLLPWLNPVAVGPSPVVIPWLVSFGCAVMAVAVFLPRVGSSSAVSANMPVPIAEAWLVAGVVSCGIALLQYFGMAAPFEPLFNDANRGDAYANLRQRNQFASLTNIGLAALIWFANRTDSLRNKLRMPVNCLLGCLLGVGNAASSSRTGMIQLLMLAALAFLWRGWRTKPVLTALGGALLGYGIAAFELPMLAGLDSSIYGINARLLEGDEVCASRLTLWSNVLHLIAQKPWFGWGWGELDYAHYITVFDGPRFCAILDNAHNLPLHLAVELGLPVALLVCGGFIGWIFWSKPWKETAPKRQLAWAVLGIILLHSMLEYPLWYGPFQIASVLCLLMLRRPSRPFAGLSNAATKASRAVLLLASMAAVYAAWDYWRVSQIYLPVESRQSAWRDNTLEKVRASWLFANQVRFAELSLTPLTPDNARWNFDTARALLHFSPEPRVIERLIESATMLGYNDEAIVHLARYKAAFPEDYAKSAVAKPRSR
jgi:O-antigen ligase